MVAAIDHASEEVLRERVADFALRGFTVIPGALSSDELSALNRAIDEDRARNFEQWHKRGARESGRTQSVDLLMATSAFDAVCAHPAVLPTLRRLLGKDVRQQRLAARPCSACSLSPSAGTLVLSRSAPSCVTAPSCLVAVLLVYAV